MNIHFRRELDKIEQKLLSLGAKVEDRLFQVTQAVAAVDSATAKIIISSDYEIDEMEVEIEEDCLKVMALYQPVAIDLRFLVAMIKINNDLERIGDEVVNIAERLSIITRQSKCDFTFDYSEMAAKTQFMLKKSLESFVNMDLDVALSIKGLDDAVDNMRNNAYDRIKEAMQTHRDYLGYLINLLLISRHLERIADHATNIAEEVVYIIEGEIIRHHQL